MIPQGIESRPELQMRSDILAFGFAGVMVPDQTAVSLLKGELRNHILTATENRPAGIVVVDLRNVSSLSTNGLGRLRMLQGDLSEGRWKLVVLLSDPILRQVFLNTKLDHLISIASDEAELRDLITTPGVNLSPQDAPPDFSESELAEMEAGGITLEDAIRAVEALRG